MEKDHPSPYLNCDSYRMTPIGITIRRCTPRRLFLNQLNALSGARSRVRVTGSRAWVTGLGHGPGLRDPVQKNEHRSGFRLRGRRARAGSRGPVQKNEHRSGLRGPVQKNRIRGPIYEVEGPIFRANFCGQFPTIFRSGPNLGTGCFFEKKGQW